jgi:hypothetical protein
MKPLFSSVSCVINCPYHQAVVLEDKEQRSLHRRCLAARDECGTKMTKRNASAADNYPI